MPHPDSVSTLARPPASHPLVRAADEIFERTSPYEGTGFVNHCRRLFHLTHLLMEHRRVDFDPGLAYLVAMLHDLGIVSERDEGPTYLHRSLALLRRETRELPLPDVDPEVLAQCMLYNHRVLPVPGLHDAAECFRNAVMIEHSRGRLRFGLSRERVAPVFAEYPRGNFDRVLLDFTWRTLSREPTTLVRGIFF